MSRHITSLFPSRVQTQAWIHFIICSHEKHHRTFRNRTLSKVDLDVCIKRINITQRCHVQTGTVMKLPPPVGSDTHCVHLACVGLFSLPFHHISPIFSRREWRLSLESSVKSLFSHNTLKGKCYPPSSTYASSQIAQHHCDWQGREIRPLPPWEKDLFCTNGWRTMVIWRWPSDSMVNVVLLRLTVGGVQSSVLSATLSGSHFNFVCIFSVSHHYAESERSGEFQSFCPAPPFTFFAFDPQQLVRLMITDYFSLMLHSM